MKKTILILSATLFIATVTFAATAPAQSRFTGHGFNSDGVFHVTVSGAAEVEASTNLQNWTKFATISQGTTLDDLTSRQMEWRFYRLRGGAASSSNVIGYVKMSIPGGKIAILGNPFSTPLRLESTDGRQAVFGMANPAAKVSLYVNGNFVTHALDKKSAIWTPALRTIRPQEGFSIENLGTSPLPVRLSGEVRQGQIDMALPVGSSLVVPPVPQPGPVSQVLGVPAIDGMQIQMFNEQEQKYQTTTFDKLEGAWLSKLPDFRPGRSLMVKTPEAVKWTKSFSSEKP